MKKERKNQSINSWDSITCNKMMQHVGLAVVPVVKLLDEEKRKVRKVDVFKSRDDPTALLKGKRSRIQVLENFEKLSIVSDVKDGVSAAGFQIKVCPIIAKGGNHGWVVSTHGPDQRSVSVFVLNVDINTAPAKLCNNRDLPFLDRKSTRLNSSHRSLTNHVFS